MTAPTQALTDRVARLTTLSRERHVPAFTRFAWPETLDDSMWWWSPEHLTLAGTDLATTTPEPQLRALARWECVNLFSLNVHGIRELMVEVLRRIHTQELPEADEYLHHFLEEENQHMWFFAAFCRRYAGKIYANKKTRVAAPAEPAIETFLAFARIFIFEEVGDYFNVAVARDPRVHPLIREINAAHHEDEARHIAFGAELLRHLARRVVAQASPVAAQAVSRSVAQFMKLTVESVYNPGVYRDAGFARGLELRGALLREPARRTIHRAMLARAIKLVQAEGLLRDEELDATDCLG